LAGVIVGLCVIGFWVVVTILNVTTTN
jgi:hypothetical protein